MMSAGQRVTADDDCPYAAFLVKPFDLDDVIATVRRIIGPADER
jgi:hypothetical protein